MTSSAPPAGSWPGSPRAAGPRSASPPGSRPATRSPSRWEQLIPAARMNVASPSRSPQSASQVARSREVSSRGSPPPPSRAAVSGLVMFRRPGSSPPQISAGPGERRRRPAAGPGSGPVPAPRGHAVPGPDDHAAGPAGHVGAARVAQVAADQPGARPQADQPGRAHPPRPSSAGHPPARGTPAISARLYGCLDRSRGSGRSAGYRCGTARRPMNRRFVRSVQPRRARQARRAPGEPLSGRRVQHHLRHRLQPEPDRVIGELAHGPQQVLRTLPPARRRQRHHLPGERRRLRRHRRRPPAGDIAGDRASSRRRRSRTGRPRHTVLIQ